MRKIPTKMLATLALLAAIGVVLARFLVPMPNPYMRFSIEAVPIIVAGHLFGPLPGALVGFLADFVGCLFSSYGYNPVFSVPPILIGLCAGLLRGMLYKKVSFLRILASFLPAVVAGSVLWQSYWLAFFYGRHSWLWFLGTRSLQFAVTSLVNAAVIWGLFRSHVFESMHLWPPASANSGQASDASGHPDESSANRPASGGRRTI